MVKRFIPEEKAKPLSKRISASRCIEIELRHCLLENDIKLDGDTPLGLSASSLSRLEGLLWRDIEYFNSLGESDEKVVELAMARLREKAVYEVAIVELIERFAPVAE